MKVLFLATFDYAPWEAPLRRHLPEADVFVHGSDDYDPATIDYALVWRPEADVLRRLSDLKGVFNLGAGVDALMGDGAYPRSVPTVRLVDPGLSRDMAEYGVHWVVHFHRGFHRLGQAQADKRWARQAYPAAANRPVGILGMGELGQSVARALLMLGFENLAGWSRSPKDLPGVESFAGQDSLQSFLNRSEILVCLLPVTDETRGLLNADTLACLPRGAFVINAGRGATVVDDDLIDALNTGRVEAAALDVFNTEPLPADHPYWEMANVFITPHVASLTNPDSAARQIAEALRAWEADETPDNVVDFKRGY